MSWQFCSSTTPKSRRKRRCIWCGEWIEIGEVYRREVGVFDGDFQSNAYHSECGHGDISDFCIDDDGRFDEHTFHRGTNVPKWMSSETERLIAEGK